MRYIFLMMMFVSVLFSAQQRQIILGSFSIKSNATSYFSSVQKTVDTDEELKRLMDKYSLKVEHKKVGDYNVVSICPFTDYPSLFQTMAEVKKQFPEAYAIKYPAFPSMMQEKPVMQEKPEVVEEEVQDKVVTEALQEEELAQDVEALAIEDEPLAVPDFSAAVKKPAPIPTPIVEAQTDDYDEIMLVILLLLVIIAYIIYKIKTKKREPEE